MFRYEFFVVQVHFGVGLIVDFLWILVVYWFHKVKKVMTNLKQDLVGKRVEGSYVGVEYTGTIVRSEQKGGEFNHTIKFDEQMLLTPKRLGYPSRYWGYKAQVYQGINWDTGSPKDGTLIIRLS